MTSDFDTNPNRAAARFPTTRNSALGAVTSDDPAARARAFETLVRAYWRPVYKHVRVKWRRSSEDARDVTQGFFARAFEKHHFGSFDPARARFRTYLRASLDHYVSDLVREEGSQKRGGAAPRLSLDFDVAEEELTRTGSLSLHGASTIDAHFDQEWTRSLFTGALATLEARCERQGKTLYFEVFRRYVLDPELSPASPALASPPSYAEVAQQCGIAVTDVTNYLSWVRRELRAHVIDELREITANEEELREEARAVLGIELEP